MVSLGFHPDEKRNSLMEWWNSTKVPLPFMRRKAAIKNGRAAAATPKAVMTVFDIAS